MTDNNAPQQKIVRRVPRTPNNQYGVVDATTIPIDKPCIIAIGGERTVSRKDANFYASLLNQLLGYYNIDDVAIYSAYYPSDKTNRSAERNQIFRNAQTRIKRHNNATPLSENEHICDLYQQIIKPRIISKNNERFSNAEAIHNLHRVMIFTHCHGAAVVRVFMDMMRSDMEKYKYDKQIIPQIMQQLLVVQHAPTAPLHNSLFNTISFMSATDTLMDFHNQFSTYVSEHGEDMVPSYFSAGNFFAAYTFTKNMVDEHQIIGLVPGQPQDQLSPDGAIIMAAERNAIINGVKSIKTTNADVLSAQQLIAPVSPNDTIKPDFRELQHNGDVFMSVMQRDLKRFHSQTTR